jgi:hypothetical protein
METALRLLELLRVEACREEAVVRGREGAPYVSSLRNSEYME